MLNDVALLTSLLLPLAAGVLTFVTASQRISWVVALVLPLVLAGTSLLAIGTHSAWVWRYEISGWQAPLGINFHIDGLAVVMLLLSSVICSIVALYALAYFPMKEPAEVLKVQGFWPIFFFLWGSLQILFVVADLFTLYVCLELITLAAVAAITVEAGAEALKSALRYLMTALVGSLLYLLGVVFIYGQSGTLDWTLIAAQGLQGMVPWVALSLVTAGLAIKSALFPLHFWLPGAHAIAPAPVSALLSALVVKASFYALLRFWVQIFPEAAGIWASHAIGALGSGAVIWGSYQAIIQKRLKLMVAYSTVAQIGYIFLAFPLLKSAMASGDAQARLDIWNGVIFFVLSHAMAKSALFLVAGIYLRSRGSDIISELKGAAAEAPVATLAWGLAGISLIGLPPSGGFLAKWLLLISSIRFGHWTYAAVILLGGLLASIYVFRVLWHAFSTETEEVSSARTPALMPMAALLLGVLIVLLGIRTTEIFSLLRIGSPFTGGLSP